MKNLLQKMSLRIDRITSITACSIFFLVFIAFNIATLNTAIAQMNNSYNQRLDKKDSIIIDFLLENNQFYNLPSSDTSNLQKYSLVRGKYFCTKIFSIKKENGKYVSLYGFGTNYSHSKNYILIKKSDTFKILGKNSLQHDIVELYNLFESLTPCIKSKQKITSYEFLVRNYTLNYHSSTHLIIDSSYKEGKNL